MVHPWGGGATWEGAGWRSAAGLFMRRQLANGQDAIRSSAPRLVSSRRVRRVQFHIPN